MTTTNLEVGDPYTIQTAGYAGTKGLPPWMEWVADRRASGTAELPSGYRRITKTEVDLLNTSIDTADVSVDVAPITLPADASCPWRCAIYAPNGAYLIADGLDGVPTIGTPKVRLTRSAPSRAVVQFALGKGKDNILSGDFGRWSDGQTRAIARGMELTVEYRDADTNSLVPVFRGRIFQIESGDTVTVTAYDRLMDLYQTTGQYLSHTGQEQGARSQSRSESGDNWVYEMGTTMGIITGVDTINLVWIDASSVTSTDMEHTGDIIIHPLPSEGGLTPSAGDVITGARSKISVRWTGVGYNANAHTAMLWTSAEFYLYEKQGDTFIERARGQGSVLRNHAGSGVRPWYLETYGVEISAGLYPPITIDDPSKYYIGVAAKPYVGFTSNCSAGASNYGADRSTSQPTISGTYYRSSNGASWAQYTESAKPIVGVLFKHPGDPVDTSAATISGTTVIIPKSSIPAGPSGTYTSTPSAGDEIIVDYYQVDKAPLADIVRELIEAAGLLPDIGQATLGMVTFYTVITTDYLTAIHGLIDTRGYGIKDNLQDAGRIALLPEHTTAETPVLSISTDPQSSDRKLIVSHNLTAHWMAEKATVAYIAENSTSSGLPLALESDDGLMEGSLIEALQTPLSAVQVDNTLGTHDMMAHSAGGAIKKLHTNVIEGTVSLAGYLPGIWDLAGSGIGGLPIQIDVPEYRAQGTVIPTEVEFGDGVTVAKLDNIRTQDRSGVANSMGLVQGTVANDATLLPKTVYVFGKVDNSRLNQVLTDAEIEGLQVVALLRENDTGIGQTNATYLRTVTDEAGYLHLLAVFPADGGTWTSPSPITTALVNIQYVRGDSHFTEAVVACLDPPKYILDNQNIHVDIRLRNQ